MKTFLLVMLPLASQPLHARRLIVAKTGAAYATVQSGLDAALAGDTVFAQAGVYNERVSFPKSGSAEAGFITLQGDSGAVLDGGGAGAGELISVDGKSYVRIIGWEVRNIKVGNPPIGISVTGGGSHIEIRDNRVHHIENAVDAHGIAVYGTAASPISHLIIDGNEVRDCKLGSSESLVLNGNVTDFAVTNNVVHDNDNIGIDFIGFEGTGPAGQDQARNGLCAGNRVYNITSGANPAYQGGKAADGIYVDGGRDIVIERNVVDNCDIAFEAASEHGGKTTAGIIVRNNFASRSYQANIMVGGYASNRGNAADISILGNTTWHGNGGEIILQNNCDGVAIRDNILVASRGNAYVAAMGSSNVNVTLERNLYFGASGSSTGAWSDAHALFADPRLANPPGDLRLEAASPAIDAGAPLDPALGGATDIDGQARVTGAARDIGADEFPGTTGVKAREVKRPGILPGLPDLLGRRGTPKRL